MLENLTVNRLYLHQPWNYASKIRDLFRDGRTYVTLGEELEHVERYLRLEQARFRDLRVTIEVPAETSGAVVPAMSVQPLVENAVRHGVERRAGTGRVRIEARVSGLCSEVTVTQLPVDPAQHSPHHRFRRTSRRG